MRFTRLGIAGITIAVFSPFVAFSQMSCPHIIKNLSTGSRGSDVAQLQQYLISQHLLDANSAMGYFGKLTEAAVQQWQSSHGIASSGSAATTGYGAVGPKTRAALTNACSGVSTTSSINTTSIQNTINALLAQVKTLQEQISRLTSGNTPSTSSQTSPKATSGTAGQATSSASCSWSGGTVASGSTVAAHQSSSVAYGSQCVWEQRTCTNGALSGSYTHPLCSVTTTTITTVASCSFNGQTVTNGSSVTAYQSACVGYTACVAHGSQCVSESRACTNGILSGSYTNASCTVAAPTVVSTPAPDPKTAFVTSLYTCILGRQPDPSGLSTWIGKLSGTSLEDMFLGFFDSQEYKNKNTSNEQYILQMYQYILGRGSDASGLDNWIKAFSNGSTRDGMIDGFVASQEFQNGIGKTLSEQTGWTLDTRQPATWPSWTNDINPFKASTAFAISIFGCNAVSFGTDPSLGNIWIGRTLNNTDTNNGCSGSTWSLVAAQMDWTSHSVTSLHKALDLSAGNVVLSDGHVINTAYDATVVRWNGETWVAFECAGGADLAPASSCIGPLTNSQTIDVARATVIVAGHTTSSASVPKLLVFQGHLYVYWDASLLTNNTLVGTVARGIELAQEASGSRRIWAKDSNGTPKGSSIYSDDPRAVEVFGRDSNDPRSNTTADLLQAVTDGTYIYFTAARGGGSCVVPSNSVPGCYRMTIGRATNPLGYHAFNQNLMPDSALPPNPEEYYRFVYRPDTSTTWLVGGNLISLGQPGEKTGMWAFPWPDNLLQPH